MRVTGAQRKAPRVEPRRLKVILLFGEGRASVDARDLDEIVGKGRRAPEARPSVRRDRVHRSVGTIERAPVAERGDDDAGIDVLGDPRDALEGPAPVRDAD